MLAQLRNVSLSFPDKKVLDDVSFTVYPGDRISLVGENGAGKTSIFRMLKGSLAPDSGEVSLSRGIRIGYLEQDFAGMEDKLKRRQEQPGSEPFVDPGGCRSYASDFANGLDQRIAKEGKEGKEGKPPAPAPP